MFEDFKFETFVDAQSGAFEEFISSVVFNLSKSNSEYRAIRNKMNGICEKYPAVLSAVDTEKSSNLSEQECKALIEFMGLRNRLHDMELEAVYFRGCYDGVGYLKKAGIL